MHRFWDTLLGPLMESLQPRVIVEVGAAHGDNTRNLLEFARHTGALVHVIDPSPGFDVDEWERLYREHLRFHRSPSLEALPAIEAPDVVLIDGDHNWYTVFHELVALADASKEGRFPVVAFHDVGWPYGRRDLYYDPDRIPEAYRHPYRRAGIRTSRDDLDADGGLNLELFNAEVVGGARNGVLTAIEDFVREREPGLHFVVVPGIHDLGILYPPETRVLGEEAADFISLLGAAPPLLSHLERVERLRVEAVIEAADRGRELVAARRVIEETSARVAELEGLLETVEQARVEEHERLEQLTQSLTLRLGQSEESAQEFRRKLRALERRRSVRLALRLARLIRPAILALRSVRRRAKRGATRGDGSATPRHGMTREQVVRGIESARSISYPIDGPLVSIIVLTRNGADRMKTLLESLVRSEYQAFEVIVVDNASTDHTSGVLSAEWPFPVHVITNRENASFSRGNNQGAERADGDLLLFLNNDVEPIMESWLAAMVDAIEEPDLAPAAVGALLVYPEIGDPERDLTVQHAGVRFGFRESAPHAFNMGATDPTDPDLAGVREVAGVSAAAMMVQADTFAAVGGFTLGYVYGAEDVDLCLKLRQRGPLVVQGDAVLWHHESATQSEQPSHQLRVQRQLNWQQYAEMWGPTIARSVRRDRLAGSGRWTGSPTPPKVAITLTQDDEAKGYGDYYTAHELGDALSEAGWVVHYAERYRDGWYDLPDDIVMVIGLLDSFDARTVGSEVVRIAWVRNWVERWLERPWLSSYDVVLAGSESARTAISRATRFDPPLVPLASNAERFAPGPAVQEFIADYAFTGNNWGVERSLLSMLEVRPEESFALYGRDWDKNPGMKRHWRGHLAYDRLPDLYRSVKVVLDDTAGPTIDHGFVNSRVFDALAAGALVLTNNRRGSDELFDGLLPVYEDSRTLRTLLDKYLADDEARLSLVESLRERIGDTHTYRRRAAQFADFASRAIEAPRLAVKIGAPDPETAHHWGDWHFANSLVRSMSSHGFHGEVHLLPEWDLPSHQTCDVVIHLRGLSRYRPKPSAVNILWVISHPEDVTEEEASAFDLVCVASPSLAETLRDRLDVPVVYLPQATDSLRFGSGKVSEELRSQVLFVGNTRNQRRPAVEWAVQAGLPLTVYGLGWERKLPRGAWRGRYFANDRLADLYASAGVVLNDHWSDMRDHGVISNRILDVLAAGGVVVSDDVPGLSELLDDAVPTYGSATELASLVKRLLGDPTEREALAARGRKAVLDAHTFEHRARQLGELIHPLLAGRSLDCDGAHFRDRATG